MDLISPSTRSMGQAAPDGRFDTSDLNSLKSIKSAPAVSLSTQLVRTSVMNKLRLQPGSSRQVRFPIGTPPSVLFIKERESEREF